MNIHQTHPHTKKIRLIVIVSIIVILIISGSAFIFRHQLSNYAKTVATSIENRDKPTFHFQTSDAPGWYSGGTFYTTDEDYKENANKALKKGDLPVSSMIVSQCAEQSKCHTEQDVVGGKCFVMLAYYDRTVDPVAEEAKKFKDAKNTLDMKITEVATPTLQFKTPEGSKAYQLHYYDYNPGDGQPIQRGNARGYVNLSKGHIEVQAVCAETQQLKETTGILSAVTLTKNN